MRSLGIRRHELKGFALTVSLIMIVLAAIIAIALIVNASSERINADSFSKRLRAEMAAQSGLNAALVALVGTDKSDPTKTAPNDFRYVTAVGTDYKPGLIPLTQPDSTGKVSLDSANKRLLYSDTTSAGSAKILLSKVSNQTVTVGYVPITAPDKAGSSQEVERYAFYVDEGGSRQNLAIQGGSDRTYTRDPNEMPLMITSAAPAPFTSQQITDLKSNRPLVFTPQTANPILSNNPASPAIDDFSFASASAIANLTPEGKPRVNLKLLKDYIDGADDPDGNKRSPLPLSQAKGNDRAKLVERLLDPAEQGVDWGPHPKSGKPGGNLSFLTKLTHYSSTQCRQIIANLIDYLDEDLIPTTDDVDNPTYFGVEGKADASGKVVGHPYINFVGTGLIFNRSSASGNVGGLNSTRIVLVLGLINPWTSPTKDWDTFYVEPEVTIHITGDASMPPGTLGAHASDYFLETFSSSNPDPAPTGNPEKSYPIKNIPPNTGYAFPVKMSGTTNYATFRDLKGTGANGTTGQPPGMVFTNLGFEIKKLRLKYKSTDGTSYYVQVLDNLKAIDPTTQAVVTTQPASPTTVNCDNSANPSALIYKFTGSAPGATDKADFHLNSDPRLNFMGASANLPTWILSKSSEPSATPAPPSPSSSIAIFSGSDPNNWDFTGATPSVSNYLWYTKTDVTADFYVKSPPARDSTAGTYAAPTFDSAGEFGYLHTGIPWETLRLYVTGGEKGGKERDKELLAYVQSGTFTPADYGSVPLHVSANPPLGATPTPVPLVGGPLNLNTSKTATLESVFLGASQVDDSKATQAAKGQMSDPDAGTIANALAANASSAPFALPTDFLALPAIQSVTNAQSKDFDREVLARRTANVIGTQSTRFTVYALGEARDKIGGAFQTTSTVNLRAEVEIQMNPATGQPMPNVLSATYYLTN